MPRGGSETHRYKALIESIFFDHWHGGVTEFEFVRDEIRRKADELEIPSAIGSRSHNRSLTHNLRD